MIVANQVASIKIGLAFLLCWLSIVPAYADFEGRVVSVADGDTITVLDARKQQHKIRLSGIDAPEKAQPFGDRSKANMLRLVFGKDVFVEERKQDRYGRTVGRVLVRPDECQTCGKTLDVSMAQLTVGLAWHFKRYEKEQPDLERGQYSFAEDEARSKRAGLWRDPNPVAPWDFRSTKNGSRG